MKKLINILIILVITLLVGIVSTKIVTAQTVLKGSIEKVPFDIYGTWRVASTLIATDSPENFRTKGVDIWNLYTENDVIILRNPFSGANAQINIQNVGKSFLEFTKTGMYDNKKLTDKVSIVVQGNSFEGINELKLETVSTVNSQVIKTQYAKYKIRGERISGQDVGKN